MHSLWFDVSFHEEGQRLDLFLSRCCPLFSRRRIQVLIKDGHVLVNDAKARPSYPVSAGDRIRLDPPPPQRLSVEPENIPIDILYQDDDLLVLDKGAGMAVHPAPGSWDGTLVNALLYHCSDLSGINGLLRPGIVHRLDKDTTGLMVVAKNDGAHRGLAAQLESRSVERCYAALAWGHPRQDRGRIDAAIGRNPRDRKKMAVVEEGRAAVTHFEVVERYAFLCLLDLRLETGRTHQIRVHLQHEGHPVFGDPLYGGVNRIRGIKGEFRRRAKELQEMIHRQALHARTLRFEHPRSSVPMEFTAELPADFSRLLEALRQGPESGELPSGQVGAGQAGKRNHHVPWEKGRSFRSRTGDRGVP